MSQVSILKQMNAPKLNKRQKSQTKTMQTENNFFKRELQFFKNFFGTKRCSFIYFIQKNLIWFFL
jgi:hypothetical protein